MNTEQTTAARPWSYRESSGCGEDGEDIEDIDVEEEKKKVRAVRMIYTTQTPYYRRLNEPIGESLYRDYLNREKRAQLIQFCQQVKLEK